MQIIRQKGMDGTAFLNVEDEFLCGMRVVLFDGYGLLYISIHYEKARQIL